ncbi:MAG: hypothetical protein ACYC10_09355 [Allorhizobium sp.]
MIEEPATSLTSGHRLKTSRGALWNWYKGGGDITLFVGFSLMLTVFVGQERIISRGEPLYWVLTIPALVLPVIRIRQTLHNLFFGIARPLAAMGIAAAVWYLTKGDWQTLIPLFLFVWSAGWACREEVQVGVKWLLVLLLCFYALGTIAFIAQPPFERFAWLTAEYQGDPGAASPEKAGGRSLAPAEQEVENKTALPSQDLNGISINPWGVLPGQTAPAYGPWRISITPNIATSGIISLLLFLIIIRRMRLKPLNLGALLAALYFAILSFVRAVFIGLAVFIATQAVLKAIPDNAKVRVATAFAMTTGFVVISGLAPYALYYLQDFGPISRLFLRGQTDLSLYDIYRQAYRPWLWSQHLRLFWESGYLMGYGSDLAKTVADNILNAGQIRSDSVSLPTRLLATYGLSTIGLVYFLGERCYAHAKNNDIWAVSMLAVIVWLMMTWGSTFHPTNALFVLALLIIGKGQSAFLEEDEDPQTPKRSHIAD